MLVCGVLTKRLSFPAAALLLVSLALPSTLLAQSKKPRRTTPAPAPAPVVSPDGKKLADAPRPPAPPVKQVVPPAPPVKQVVPPAPLRFATPDAVAARMYLNWSQRNRTQASYVATKTALDALFATEFVPMQAQKCAWGEQYQCLYMHPNDEMLDFSINVKPHSKLGFLVTSISFRADD